MANEQAILALVAPMRIAAISLAVELTSIPPWSGRLGTSAQGIPGAGNNQEKPTFTE